MADSGIDIRGLQEQIKKLKGVMSDNPAFRSRLTVVIKRILNEARKRISADAKSTLGNDPRQAYKAVRSAVYRRILGGQVNILARRKAGKPTKYQKPLKGLPARGGNRWGRSDRTMQMEGYAGMDRGFVLRFLNAGTTSRRIVSYTNAQGEKHDIQRGGNRGSIGARNWFGNSSQKALQQAASELQTLIDKIIREEFI